MSKKVIGIILVVIGVILFCYSRQDAMDVSYSRSCDPCDRAMTRGYEDHYSSNRMMKYGGIILVIAGLALIIVHHRHHRRHGHHGHRHKHGHAHKRRKK